MYFNHCDSYPQSKVQHPGESTKGGERFERLGRGAKFFRSAKHAKVLLQKSSLITPKVTHLQNVKLVTSKLSGLLISSHHQQWHDIYYKVNRCTCLKAKCT